MAWSWRRSRRRHGWPGPRRGAAGGGQPARWSVRDTSPAESGRVPSPGGWAVPPGVRPAWNWTPPPGIAPRPDRAPRWVRWWYGTQFIDRYAYSWMWWHGAWDVVPAGGGDTAGIREPAGLPLSGQFLQRGTHKDPQPLVGRADHIRLGHLGNLLLVGNVGAERLGDATVVMDAAGDLGCPPVAAAAIDRDGEAVMSQTPRDRGAQASRAACHQSDTTMRNRYVAIISLRSAHWAGSSAARPSAGGR